MLDSIRQQIAEPAQPFSLFVRIALKPETAGAFAAAAAAAATASLAETGCLAYEFHALAKAADTYLLCEKWRSFADLEAHFATPHFTAIIAWMRANERAPGQIEVGRPFA